MTKSNVENDLPKGKPVLSLDFDGVIHSYESGWKGADVIPDPPVPGALEFIVRAMGYFEVHIFSSRTHQRGGRRAMKRWLVKQYIKVGESEIQDIPEWWWAKIYEPLRYEPWTQAVKEGAKSLVGNIKFPKHKPPAMISIDDRAIQFTGEFPDPKSLLDFKPWNKK